MEDDSALSLLDIVEKWAKDKGFHATKVICSKSYINLAKSDRGGGFFTLWEDGYISSPFMEDFTQASLKPTHPDFFKNIEYLIKKTTT